MAGLHITEDDLLFADGDVSVTFNSSTGNYVFDVDADIVNAVGNDTEIQFNDQGTFGSSPDLTFDNSNGLSTKGLVLNSDGSLVDSFASVKDQTGSDVVTFNEAGLGFSRDRSRYAVDTRGGRIRSGKLPPVDNLSASSNVSGSLEVEYYVCAVDKSGANTEAKKVTVSDVPENTKAFGIDSIEIQSGDFRLIPEGFQSIDPSEISVGEQFNLYYVYYDGQDEEFRFSDDTFEAQEQVVTVKSIDTDGLGFVDSIVIEETLPYNPSSSTLAYIYETGTTEKVDISWDPVDGALFYGIGKNVTSKTGEVVFVGRTTSTSFEDFTTGTTNFDSGGGIENFPTFAPGGTGGVQSTARRNKTGDVHVDGNLTVGNPDPSSPTNPIPLNLLHKKELGSAGESKAVKIEQDITELDSILDNNFNQQDYLALEINQTIKPETPGNTDSGVSDMEGISLDMNTEAALSALGMGMAFDGSFDEVTGYEVRFTSDFSALDRIRAFLADMRDVDTGFSQFNWPRAIQVNAPDFDEVNGSDEWFGLYVGGENPYNQIGGQVNIGDSDRADQNDYYLNIKQIDGDTSKGFFNVALQPNNSPLFSIRNSEEILLAGENKVNITAPKVEISEPTDGSSTEQILTRNPSTGEIEKISSLDISAIASTGIQAGLGLESTFNASTGITTLDVDVTDQDTESEFILRDSSTGELISINDNASPPLQAKYEGSGAFTLGHRDVSNGVGESSIVIGGTESDPSSAPGTNNIAIGPGNEVGFSSVFQTETSLSFAFGSKNTLENIGTIAVGLSNSIEEADGYAFGRQNSITNGDNSYILGRENTIDSSNGDNLYVIGRNNVITSNAENALLFGKELSWGANGGLFETTVVLGSKNEDVSDSNVTFLVGSGESGTTRNAIVTKLLGPNSNVTHFDNLYLGVDPTESWNGISNKNLVIGSTKQIGSNAILDETIVVDSVVGVANLRGAFVLGSDLLDEETTQGGRGSMFINATLNTQSGKASEIYENAFIHSTRIGEDDQGNNNNSRKFAVTESGAGPISAFTFNDDTILAYQAVGPNNEREGSLVLVGTGSVDSPIKDVQDSLSIRGATMRAPRSVGIGPNVEVNTPDKIVLGNDNGTVVKQVQGSTADLFSVNLYDSSAGDAINQALTVEDDGSIVIGQDEINIQAPGNGVVVTTPDGTTQYRIAVDNNGNVTSEEV